jgi:acyl-[acyl-carrier-protein]-phospholipid O-acyltransferase/long-chain-fatty-acid--[acyl-carrier-protein] ligase
MPTGTTMPAVELSTATPGRSSAAPASGSVNGPFAAMTTAYCLGVFNDSFFKQSCMLIAVGRGRVSLQGAIAIVFILPYLLAAAPAGWLADRYPKHRIVIATKALEVLAMLLGALGILWVSWPLVLAMAFTMGLQSCLFSPAMNGFVPELFPPARVVQANSVLKAAMIAAVLLGLAQSGVVLETGGRRVAAALGGDAEAAGRGVVAVVVVGVALLGLLASLAAPARPAAAPRAPFPWTGPLDTLRELRRLARDRRLLVAALLGTFVWAVGSLQAMLINPMGKLELGWGDTATSGLLAVEMIGVAVGGGLAGGLARGAGFRRWLVPSLVAMAGLLGAFAGLWWVPAAGRYFAALGLLFASGVAGGLVLVPCEAYLQVAAAPEHRGAVLGAYGSLFGAGVVLSGLLSALLNALLPPTLGLAATGALTLVLAGIVRQLLPKGDEP